MPRLYYLRFGKVLFGWVNFRQKSGDLPANLNRGLMSAGSSLGFVLVASKKSDQNSE